MKIDREGKNKKTLKMENIWNEGKIEKRKHIIGTRESEWENIEYERKTENA